VALEVFTLEKICDSLPGVVTIGMTDPTNTDSKGFVIDENLATIFHPRSKTARYSFKTRTSEAGDYIVHTLRFFCPNRSTTMETIVARTSLRKVAIVLVNKYGQTIRLPESKVEFEYDSGGKPTDDEGYNINITFTQVASQALFVPASSWGTPVQAPSTLPGETEGGAPGGGNAAPPTGTCNMSVQILNTNGVLTALISNSPDPNLSPEIFWFLDNNLLGSSTSHTVTNPGSYSVQVIVGDCETRAVTLVRSQCELMTISPYLIGNTIHANITDPPPNYTLNIKSASNAIVGTALPFTPTVSGAYIITVFGQGCEKNAGISVTISTCTFTATIDDTTLPGSLQFTTDAPSGYTYRWLIMRAGQTTLFSTEAIINPTLTGLYILEITQGSCIKPFNYLFEAKTTIRPFEAHYNFTGHTLIVNNINLKAITDPDTQLIVRIGGQVATFTNVTPTNEYHYAINKTNNTILFWTALPPTNIPIYINQIY
jgi:hypothetical protein